MSGNSLAKSYQIALEIQREYGVKVDIEVLPSIVRGWNDDITITIEKGVYSLFHAHDEVYMFLQGIQAGIKGAKNGKK